MIFLGALISAIMSSADSSLLAATSLMTNNILLRIFPPIKKQNILPLVRAMTAVLAVISMGVALYVKQIYNLMVNSWATLFVGIFVPVTAAIYWKKANTFAAWASMILGTVTWLGYIVIENGVIREVSDPTFYRAAAYGGAASLLSYIVATFLYFARKRQKIGIAKNRAI
jgi:Na+/proline symporter